MEGKSDTRVKREIDDSSRILIAPVHSVAQEQLAKRRTMLSIVPHLEGIYAR